MWLRKITSEHTPSVLIHSEEVNDPQVTADAFNLSLHQEESGNVISFLEKAFPRKFPGVKTIPTTKTYKSIIHSLKAKNYSDYDRITNKILNVSAS
jgi:hypothetical protein